MFGESSLRTDSVSLSMSAPLGEVNTEAGPPLAIPLQHFLVGLVFLVAGVSAGALASVRSVYLLPHVHLLLVGWVCVTIMGAMTQFVPVLSDVSLHSQRLAQTQLLLVVVGVAGLASAFAFRRYAATVFPGAVLLAGFWVFVYNIGRTLPSLDGRRLDVTETHFVYALVFAIVATFFGVTLAADYRWNLLVETQFSRDAFVAAHAVLAVFGIVVTTVIGAMYQLVTMFTQTELEGIEVQFKKFERIAYPSGVVVLALGRLFGVDAVASAGAGLVLVSLTGFGLVALRKLHESLVDVTEHPMLVRYVVASFALLAWTPLAVPELSLDPLSSGFAGEAATTHVLFAGFIGFIVVGTLYHIVPFLVWVESYSARLGLEDVPMIDDLYDTRLERADLALTFLGAVGVVVGLRLGNTAVVAASGGVAAAGYAVFAVNLLLVVSRHKPGGVGGLVGYGGWTSRGRGKEKGE